MNPDHLMALVVVSLALTGCGRSEPPPPARSPSGTADTSGAPHTDALPDSLEFIARGNEPFWAITVSADEILFQEPERIDGVRGPAAAPIRQGARLIFRTVLSDSVPVPVELTLEEKHCQDSMSGFDFAYTATAQVGDRHFDGCAERRPRAAAGARP